MHEPQLASASATKVSNARWGDAFMAGAQSESVQGQHSYLTERVHKVVWQKSISAQIRQLILYINDAKGKVDGFVRELTFDKQLYKHFL